MGTYYLKTPIDEKEIRELKVGDVIYVDGIVITARDAAHRRAVDYYEKGLSVPVSFEGNVVYHCGPLVKKVDEKWVVVSAGPTTSTRMEYIMPAFIKLFKPRVIVGKGGLKDGTLKALSEHGAVYASYPGGVGVTAALMIEDVVKVEWLDLGPPEALWVLKVKNFGPLIVTMDSHGNSVHKEVEAEAKRKLDELLKRI